MDEPKLLKCDEPADSAPTCPGGLPFSMRGFETKQRATEFGQLVGAYIHEFSRDFDLSQLDGVTIAYDYVQALLDLDRGYETSHRLTPSDTHVIGIAMTPCVMRGSNLKSHIILDANFLVLLESTDHDDFGLALHMLAHDVLTLR